MQITGDLAHFPAVLEIAIWQRREACEFAVGQEHRRVARGRGAFPEFFELGDVLVGEKVGRVVVTSRAGGSAAVAALSERERINASKKRRFRMVENFIVF